MRHLKVLHTSHPAVEFLVHFLSLVIKLSNGQEKKVVGEIPARSNRSVVMYVL